MREGEICPRFRIGGRADEETAGRTPFRIDVEAAPGAHQQELAEIREAFARAGLEVRPKAQVGLGIDPTAWVISVTLAAPIATFFTTFASKAAEDAYAPVKQWVHDLWAARRGAGSVVLQDFLGSTLVLSSALPEAALDALRDLDWAEVSGQYLVWSEDKNEWLDPRRTGMPRRLP
jgi:hypothetical protein